MVMIRPFSPRLCKLKECRQEFHPKTTWQVYHHAQCRNRDKYLHAKAALQFMYERKGKP